MLLHGAPIRFACRRGCRCRGHRSLCLCIASLERRRRDAESIRGGNICCSSVTDQRDRPSHGLIHSTVLHPHISSSTTDVHVHQKQQNTARSPHTYDCELRFSGACINAHLAISRSRRIQTQTSRQPPAPRPRAYLEPLQRANLPCPLARAYMRKPDGAPLCGGKHHAGHYQLKRPHIRHPEMETGAGQDRTRIDQATDARTRTGKRHNTIEKILPLHPQPPIAQR
ncbi:hypothetical protein BU16DRAFT_311308 [Lophium mytilinum]|uniref:Uncharacterized protein n=1 Tax=Lophium mytilinum TaxID=390894 RepID=A0A6A6QYL9_9PEZI|nr:hypothetical protein BU16DRAFT_311308 [Lophium mytilinum]